MCSSFWGREELRKLLFEMTRSNGCTPSDFSQLEYVFGSDRYAKLRTTCMYGVIYCTLGNLSGNCVAFGIYVLEAASINESHESTARGLAVVCMSAACLLHATTRQGGIYTIVIMAIFKVCILIAIIVIGFAALGGKTFGYGHAHGETILDNAAQTGPGNLDLHNSFAHAKTDFASYANSILFVLCTFSGQEQPFYVCVDLQSRFSSLLIVVLGAQ